LRELLAVLALQDQRDAVAPGALREAAEAVVGVREPVAAFRVFAFVDDVEADLALPADDVRDRGHPFLDAAEPGGLGQAADVGRQDSFRAAPHDKPPQGVTVRCAMVAKNRGKGTGRRLAFGAFLPGKCDRDPRSAASVSRYLREFSTDRGTMLRTGLSLSVLFVLAGCAGMSEQACLVSDWRTIGFEHGASGRPVSSFGTYRQQCARHGVAPDLEAYRAGHAAGVESYCRPSRGFDVGRR